MTLGELTRSAGIFCGVSWIPLATWIAAEVYVSGFDGWGQWAAAPILVVPFVLSIALALTGLVAHRRARGSSHMSARYVGWCTVLAGIPAMWIIVRAIVI